MYKTILTLHLLSITINNKVDMMSTKNWGCLALNNLDEKYKKLKNLESTINLMRDRLHKKLMDNLDPLNDEVLALSKELDVIICEYTILKMELKDH